MRLVNARNGDVVARDVEIAATRATRRTGLLGRDALDPATAFILSPCFSVHTAFMRFPIDVVFLDADGVVQRVVAMPAWRIAIDVRARAVIEMAAGSARDVRAGDRLYLSEVSGTSAAVLSSFTSPSLRRFSSSPGALAQME